MLGMTRASLEVLRVDHAVLRASHMQGESSTSGHSLHLKPMILFPGMGFNQVQALVSVGRSSSLSHWSRWAPKWSKSVTKAPSWKLPRLQAGEGGDAVSLPVLPRPSQAGLGRIMLEWARSSG